MSIEWLSPVSREFAPTQGDIDFALIRNPLGHSPLLSDRVREKIGTTETDLTRELGDLWHIPPDMMILSKGSTGIIKQIPRLFLRPSDTAVVPVPTYFGLLEEIPPRQVVEMQLPIKEGFIHTADFQHELISTIDAVRPGLVWLCSPNNPTGVVTDRQHIEEIARHTAPGFVIVDEAYQELVDPANSISAMHLIPEHPNIIVTKTFSKAYGLPEIQVGVAVAAPQVSAQFQNERLIHPEVDSLALASAAITDQNHIRGTHTLMKQEIAFVWDHVQRMQQIEMGAHTESGVCILRHRTRRLGEELLRRRIKTSDFNQQAGIRDLQFVRLGLLDHENNIKLIRALQECDPP